MSSTSGQNSEAWAKAVLRDNGFRATEGRVRLLRLLQSHGKPVTAEFLTERLGAHLHVANVYRALRALAARDLVHMTRLESGKDSFEFSHGTHHHHVVCTGCGVVEDVHISADSRLNKEAQRESSRFASVEHHALEFFGTCRTCA
ncbi:MAG TPA: Fur family transcriptional regulator [Candidatus Paceibacterota bacterium]